MGYLLKRSAAGKVFVLRPTLLEPGDIVLSTSSSAFSHVIRRSTRSCFSHASLVNVSTSSLVESTGDWRVVASLLGIRMGEIRVVATLREAYTYEPVVLRLRTSKSEDATIALSVASAIASTSGQYYAPMSIIVGLAARLLGTDSVLTRSLKKRVADIGRPEAFCSQVIASGYKSKGYPLSDNDPYAVFPGDLEPSKIAKYQFYPVDDCVREIPTEWRAQVPEPRQAIFFDLGRSIVRDPAARDALAEYYLPIVRSQGRSDWARRLADRVREPAGATFPIFTNDPTSPGVRTLDEIIVRHMTFINFESRLVKLAQPAIVSSRAENDAWGNDVRRADLQRLDDERRTAKTTLDDIRARRRSNDSRTLSRMEDAYERLLAELPS